MKRGDMVVVAAETVASAPEREARPPIPPHELYDPFLSPRSASKDLDNRLNGVAFTPFCE